MFFREKQIFRQTDTKRLIFDSNCPGNKYYVYKKINWFDEDRRWESWECVMTFGTQGEANTYFENMNDLPCERDYVEYINMRLSQ